MKHERILFASRNIHKYKEVASLLGPLEIEILFGPDIASLEVEETGRSYAENSLLKALQWSRSTGMVCMADDSGLEVKSLGWWPGKYSARIGESDNERNSIILDKLSSEKDRICRYVASFALYDPFSRQTWLTMGMCWGNIARQPAGNNGFGYDPLFVPNGYDKTFGELGKETKELLSHRSVAVKLLVGMLSQISVIE